MKASPFKYKTLIAVLLAVVIYKVWNHWMEQATKDKYLDNAIAVQQQVHIRSSELAQEELYADSPDAKSSPDFVAAQRIKLTPKVT